jgi:hypothetical protein
LWLFLCGPTDLQLPKIERLRLLKTLVCFCALNLDQALVSTFF